MLSLDVTTDGDDDSPDPVIAELGGAMNVGAAVVELSVEPIAIEGASSEEAVDVGAVVEESPGYVVRLLLPSEVVSIKLALEVGARVARIE